MIMVEFIKYNLIGFCFEFFLVKFLNRWREILFLFRGFCFFISDVIVLFLDNIGFICL